MSIREIKRTALVTFSPEQMFDLVVDVERYREFLPWVAGAQVHEKSERDLAGQHHDGAGGHPPELHHAQRDAAPRMDVAAAGRRTVQAASTGLWTFTPIGGTAGTKIVLEMTFEFANPVASMLFGRAFEQSVGELIDAFVARARTSYASTPAEPAADTGGG